MVVAGSTRDRHAIKSPRSTQPSFPSGLDKSSTSLLLSTVLWLNISNRFSTGYTIYLLVHMTGLCNVVLEEMIMVQLLYCVRSTVVIVFV